MKEYYIIVTARYETWLQNEVNEKLLQGYVLYGFPFSRNDDLCQALILSTKES